MALRGDLASVDLAQVFQMLALNKKVGLLSIHSAELWKVLYFDQRGVSVHHNVHAVIDRVLAAFVRSGRLEEDSLDEVRDHAVRMGQTLSDSLLAGGYLDQSELEEQYRFALEEEIYDLFFCNDAKFEFHEDTKELEGRDGTVDTRFFYNCDSVIMEAARRIDEWAFITERIPNTAEILVATAEHVSADEFGNDGPAIFELLDGRRNVDRIVQITGLTTFSVCKTLSQLLDAHAIAPVAQEDLVALGDECMAEGRLPDAISLYERAIDLGIGLPESYALAARAYQAVESYELSVFHLESEAEHRITTGDLSGAAACLYEVKELMPTDLSARERLVELTLGVETVKIDGFDPLAEGKAVVDLLTEIGDIERVRVLLERLLTVEPNDPDLKKALVSVHLRAGDQTRVMQLYESIADDLDRASKPLEAVSYLQKILQLDRSRSDISERVRKLYECDERARKRSRALLALAVLFCLLIVTGSGYWFYNQRAEEAFARIDVQDLLLHEDFAGARGVYAGFSADYPLTTSIGKAKAELQSIESAQGVFEARRNSERSDRAAKVKKIRKLYRAEWNRHRQQFRAGDPEGALVALETVRSLLAESAAHEDVEWALGQQVELTWKNLVEFLAESKRLGEIYDENIAANDWLAAREVALLLQEDFEHTESGRRVRVPVMVVTYPAGAQLMHSGKPLMRNVGGQAEPLITPAIVLCQAGQPANLTVSLSGYAAHELVVSGKQSAQLDVVLEVVPEHTVTFSVPSQTGVGVGDGWLAVGLRGGKIGFARCDGSNRKVVDLGGLKAVESDPVIQSGRIFFVSNEMTVECVPVDPSIRVDGWPITLADEAATPLSIGDGRIALVDQGGILHCWEQATGRLLWTAALDGTPSGPPTVANRKVYVGTSEGSLVVFDLTDGHSHGVLRSPVGLTTAIKVVGKSLFFGCSDGAVRAVDFDAGKVLWCEDIGRVPSSFGMAISQQSLMVVAKEGVLALDLVSGKRLGEMLTSDVVQGVSCQRGRTFVRVRRPGSQEIPAHDVLVACSSDSASVLWQYILPSTGSGSIGVDGSTVALPAASGQVVLFR